MCPVCLMSVAARAAGVTSSGGLTALVMRGIRSGNGTGDFRHKNEKKSEARTRRKVVKVARCWRTILMEVCRT
jgi:hypothetical protein